MRLTLLAATALVLVAPAHAGQNGFYVGIEGGAGIMPTMEGFETFGALFFGEKVEIDTGWAVLATVGYEWGNWRFEAEGGYRSNDMERIVFTTGTWNTNVDDLNQLTLMGNMLYDLAVQPGLDVSIGAGFGFNHLSFDWPGFGGQPGGVQGDDWAIAYQGIVGVNYALEGPFEVFANYRYLYTNEFDFEDRINRQHFDNVQTHTFSLGLRYSLGQ
jgi:opacity protein-like surface antigen